MSRDGRVSRLGNTLGALTLGFFLCLNCQLQAQKTAEPLTTPEVISVIPVAAQQGSVFEAQVRGKNLEGAYAVWFATQGATGRVEKVEQIELDSKPNEKTGAKKPVLGHLAFLKIEVDPDANRGKHSFRLVTSNGLSNALEFLVDARPVTLEIASDHSRTQDAQHLEFPAVVIGKISEMAERDFYSFDVAVGQELTFHAVSNTTHNAADTAQFTLYREGGSWYDPERPLRLAFAPDARLTHTFETPGRYFVAVTSFQGLGGPDYSYRLCVGQPGSLHFPREEERLTPPSPNGIDEVRSPFRRKLEPDRLQALQARTVVESATGHGSGEGKSSAATGRVAASDSSSGTDAVHVPTDYSVLTETEPNETADQASEVTLPFLLEVQSSVRATWTLSSSKFQRKRR